jgi:hypothetical protein
LITKLPFVGLGNSFTFAMVVAMLLSDSKIFWTLLFGKPKSKLSPVVTKLKSEKEP